MVTQSGRDRSLGGCGTCRSRHTKCDESRPICNVCRFSNLTCTGYDIRLRFVYHGEKDVGEVEPNAVRFRRPLYTEPQREVMSRSISRSFRGIDPNQALMELDEQSLTASPEEYPLSRGPFGVFQLQPVQPSDPGSHESHTLPLAGPSPNDTIEQAFAMSEDTMDFFDSLPLEYALTTVVEDSRLFDDDIIPCTDSFTAHENTIANMDNDDERLFYEHIQDFALQSAPSRLIPNISSPLPEDSWPLLANYRDRVIPLLAPLNTNKKSPWHHIILPCAMNTMAEITMGWPSSHARTALLYTLLATSATHAQLSSSSDFGDGSSPTVAYYKHRARHELKACLQKEMTASYKVAKYKDVLMALISMSILNVFEEDADSLLACLLVTEQFIKRKGLSKATLSRKVRLLHHCYAYLRIVNESIIVSDMSTDPFQQLGVFPDPRTTTRACRFRISQWSDTPDFTMTKVKPLQLGQQDIHLEHPGRWELTMYPEIFGIPESLLYLMSHVTRLGNERDLLINSPPDDECPSPRDFLIRAKMLEKHICRWDPKQDSEDASSSTAMVAAIQKALLIFFYRRFYDVEASILQEEVHQVKELLQSSRASEQNVYMIWPGFIAACEAIKPDLQAFFRGWFVHCFRQTGLPSFQAALSIAESIWASGNDERGLSLQWPDIVRSNRRLVIF